MSLPKYHETITDPVISVMTVFMGGLAAFFLFLLFYQRATGPVGNDPAPDWVYLVMFLVFAGVTVLVANLRRLVIILDSQSVTAVFGRFRHSVPFTEIKECYRDRGWGIKWGGWGIRLSLYKGHSVLVYNVLGAPRVAVELKSGKRFVFSTKQPDILLTLIKQQVK